MRGKWGGDGGGEMGGNGGNGEMAGIAHMMWVVEGCGGMWLRKMRGKWEKNETRYPFFTVPISPLFQRSQISATTFFIKLGSPHSSTEKWDLLPLTDTHCHGGSCGCLFQSCGAVTGACESGWGAVSGGWKYDWGGCGGMGMPWG